MTAKKRPEGAFILWPWGDKEIEEPKRLRNQLLEIVGLKFSGVLVTLSGTRYEFIDPAVLRALAQASQWAKARNVAFWFHTDPRQASRSFIAKTGERMQNLITVKEFYKQSGRKHPHLIKIIDNRFELQYKFPGLINSPALQENAILFEPVGLERAFLFQKNNGTIIHDTLRDVTPLSRFHADIESGIVTVFGSIRVPPKEEWWVIAFPKFNTNAYDFSGRENADLLGQFVENVFDACTHLSGISWCEGRGGYLADLGRLPVSLSLFNTFRAEFGYELRDVLYALAVDVDDESHIPIRRDYHTALVDSITDAQMDFHRMVHAYFSEVNVGHHHTCERGTTQTTDLFRGTFNPWNNTSLNVFFTDIHSRHKKDFSLAAILPKIIMAKSLGFLTSAQRGFISFSNMNLTQKERNHIFELFNLYSLEPLVRISDSGSLIIEGTKKREWDNLLRINERIHQIRQVTGFRFPEANVAILYPTETLMTTKPRDIESKIQDIDRLITCLSLRQLQCDVLSSTLMERGRLAHQGYVMRGQVYESIVFPFPEVVSQRNLEILSILEKRGFPLFLGGCVPRFTEKGKRIPHKFNGIFDMKSKDFGDIVDRIKPLFEYPENALATMIQYETSDVFLICPKNAGESIKGEIHHAENVIPLPETRQLMIFQRTNSGEANRLL